MAEPQSPAAEPVVPAMTAADQRRARIAGGTLAVLGTGSLAGVAASLYLVKREPLLLVLLSPIGRHVLLVAPLLDPWILVPAVAARRMLFYLGSFHLGRAFGPRAVPWIEARAGGFARFVRWLERMFARYGHGLVLAFPSPTVAVLAGISPMRTWVFAALAIPGVVVRLVILVRFAEWLRRPIEILLNWLDDNRLPGTVVLLTVIALNRWRRSRRGPVPPADEAQPTTPLP